MADSAARRETRRRKILENSKNRLKLITGENEELVYGNVGTFKLHEVTNSSFTEKTQEFENCPTELHICKTVESNEYDAVSLVLNNATQSLLLPNELQRLLPETNAALEEETVREKESSKTVNSLPYSRKVIFIALAIIIRLLFIFQMQFCVRDSIVLPFIIVEVTLQVLCNNAEAKGSLLHTVLLFSSLPPQTIARVIRIFNLFNELTEDFFLYFFTFLTVHVCLNLLI